MFLNYHIITTNCSRSPGSGYVCPLHGDIAYTIYIFLKSDNCNPLVAPMHPFSLAIGTCLIIL